MRSPSRPYSLFSIAEASITNRHSLSLGILSAAIIAFQLALMQVLSLTQWNHFAFMVISVALLGFGAAGTLITVFRQQLNKHIHYWIPACMIGCGISMSLVVQVSQHPFIRFDSYLLFADYAHVGRLLLSYLLFFIPFLLGALAIALAFDHYVAAIGKLYFANLTGSALGGLLLLMMTGYFFPARLPAILAVLPVLAGALIIPAGYKGGLHLQGAGNKKQRALFLFTFVAIVVCAWTISLPPVLQVSQYKDISKVLQLPDAVLKIEKPGPYGVVQAIHSPVLRYAPGLSLLDTQPLKANTAVFVNGDWLGAVSGGGRDDTPFFLQQSSFDLPYRMAARKDVLVLQAGTGMEAAHAFSHQASRIVAVEANSVLTAALKRELAADNDLLFLRPSVSLLTREPYTFLFSDTSHYDLICLPAVGSFGGSAGLYALQEQFLLTREAFVAMWNRLKPEGVISVTAWVDYPARNSLKLLATLAEVLEEVNVEQPVHHIAAIRSWATISFVVRKTALTEPEIQRIRTFCDRWQFDVLVLPGLLPGERNRYHQLQDSSFFQYVDTLLSAGRNAFYQEYEFNIKPASSDRPYFSQFLRWKSLPKLGEYFGNRSLPFFEVGYLLVGITLIQIVLVSFVLILLPLFKTGWRAKLKAGTLCYFGGIGLGFMFVEMAFIQHFMLYFGHPVYAAGAAITTLLLFSGFGSYRVGYFAAKRNRLPLLLGGIVLCLLVYSVLLMPVLQHTAQVSLPVKWLIVLVLSAPLAFCMGIPFPAGLLHLAESQAQDISWAWGVNGCVSVISAALATLLAVEVGFGMVIGFAAIAYCIPLLVCIKWK